MARVIRGKSVCMREGALLQADDEGNVTYQWGMSNDDSMKFSEEDFIQLASLARDLIEEA